MSLVEVVMSTLLVGVMLVGAMNLLCAVVRGRTETADMARAQQYAQQLMTEILSNAYSESGNFGPNPTGLLGLGGPEVRSEYDDVDDYHLMEESPFLPRTGNIIPLPNTTRWRRRVNVIWVDPNDPATQVLSDQGVKRITVTIIDERSMPHRSLKLSCLRSDKYPPVTPP